MAQTWCKILLAFFLGLIALEGVAYSGQALTLGLEDCVKLALTHNPEIMAFAGDIESARWQVTEAKPGGIPVVNYKYRLAPAPRDLDDPAASFFTGDITAFNSFRVELGGPLATFGKISTARGLAEINVDSKTIGRVQKSEDIILKIHQLYYGIQLARQLMSLMGEARDTLHAKVVELTGEKFVDQLAILKLRVILFELEKRVDEAIKQEEVALAALHVLTGLDGSQSIQIKTQKLVPVTYDASDYDALIRQTLARRSEAKLLDLGLAAKAKQIKLERAQRLPNLGWGGFFDYGIAPKVRGDQDEDAFSNPFNYTRAGVGFELGGTFDFVKTRAKIKEAEADLYAILLKREAAKRGFELDVKQAYEDLREAKKVMGRAVEAITVAQKMVFLTKSNLEIGLGDKKDYLDSLQHLLLFKGRYLESVYNYNVAASKLQQKTGALSEQYGLKDVWSR